MDSCGQPLKPDPLLSCLGLLLVLRGSFVLVGLQEDKVEVSVRRLPSLGSRESGQVVILRCPWELGLHLLFTLGHGSG